MRRPRTVRRRISQEMITEAKHHVDPLSPAGISEADLNAAQKAALRQIGPGVRALSS